MPQSASDRKWKEGPAGPTALTVYIGLMVALGYGVALPVLPGNMRRMILGSILGVCMGLSYVFLWLTHLINPGIIKPRPTLDVQVYLAEEGESKEGKSLRHERKSEEDMEKGGEVGGDHDNSSAALVNVQTEGDAATLAEGGNSTYASNQEAEDGGGIEMVTTKMRQDTSESSTTSSPPAAQSGEEEKNPDGAGEEKGLLVAVEKERKNGGNDPPPPNSPAQVPQKGRHTLLRSSEVKRRAIWKEGGQWVRYFIDNEGCRAKQRYCKTCNVWKDPDTAHCSMCGYCMKRLDHHCPAMGTCVAAFNHRFFVLFLLSSGLGSTILLCSSIIARMNTPFQDWRSIALIVMMVFYGFNMLFVVFGLTHCYMLLVGQTTRGNIKNPEKMENCECSTSHYKMVFCAPIRSKFVWSSLKSCSDKMGGGEQRAGGAAAGEDDVESGLQDKDLHRSGAALLQSSKMMEVILDPEAVP
mmetsp:Transcript_46306/g.77059  ORF Transcript_46306/g.77059 Transcript_46306/m.77059 type:complete len:468 (-) Transcript_46306:232-1635(-)